MENSPLTRLPAELRNHISVLALSHEEAIKVEAILPGNNPASAYQWVMRKEQPLALTQTCKAMRAETLKLFYASNSLRLVCHQYAHGAYFFNRSLLSHAPWVVHRFVERYGATNAALARQIIIDTGTLNFGDLFNCRFIETMLRQAKPWVQPGPLQLDLSITMTLYHSEGVQCNINMLNLAESVENALKAIDERLNLVDQLESYTLSKVKSLLFMTSYMTWTLSTEECAQDLEEQYKKTSARLARRWMSPLRIDALLKAAS